MAWRGDFRFPAVAVPDYAAAPMRLLDRYLLRELLLPLAFCLCGFVVVFITMDLFNQLNEFRNKALSAAEVVELKMIVQDEDEPAALDFLRRLRRKVVEIERRQRPFFLLQAIEPGLQLLPRPLGMGAVGVLDLPRLFRLG